MSSFYDTYYRELLGQLREQGYLISSSIDPATGYTKIRVVDKQTDRAAEHLISDLEMFTAADSMKVRVDAVRSCIEKITTEYQAKKSALSYKEVCQELDKYKAAVKQLAFELEMASGKSNAKANVDAIRKMALEQAAEFVMDWGIPKDGRDLDELCQQITKLRETKAMVMERAVESMDRFFGGAQ